MTLYFSIYFAKTNIMAISTQTLYKVETFPLIYTQFDMQEEQNIIF